MKRRMQLIKDVVAESKRKRAREPDAASNGPGGTGDSSMDLLIRLDIVEPPDTQWADTNWADTQQPENA
jgi:hypothetical protein